MSNTIPSRGQLSHDRDSTPRAFEIAFSKFVESKEGFATASGRAALALALRASGVSTGDEVIIPSIVCGAVADAVLSIGALPVLADCDGVNGNIEPTRLRLCLSTRTRAVVAVHYQGLPCDINQIQEFSQRNGITMIEDCAHSIGSRHASRHVGTFGDFAIYSFGPDKPITTGCGGMLTSSTEAGAKAIGRIVDSRESFESNSASDISKSLKEVQLTSDRRLYGMASCLYFPLERLVSSLTHQGHTIRRVRMSGLAARIGMFQLQSIGEVLRRRVKNAARIREMLQKSEFLLTPEHPRTDQPVFLRCTALAESSSNRDRIVLMLKRNGIEAGPINWRTPLHRSPRYSSWCRRPQTYEGTEAFSQRFFNVPCHPLLDKNDFEVMRRCFGA